MTKRDRGCLKRMGFTQHGNSENLLTHELLDDYVNIEDLELKELGMLFFEAGKQEMKRAFRLMFDLQ